MLNTFIGRQPIFNIHGECLAYELLYRSCDVFNNANFENNSKATARVIINLIHNIGLDPIIGNKIGFVNVDENILFSDMILLLPKEAFKFEILEYTKISLGLCERIKELHALGYRFSLDDFDCSDEMIKNYEALFPYVDIIKVDVLAIRAEFLEKAIQKLEKYNIDLLAEKIENYEMYEICKKLHFKFFQGYFFEKPLIMSGQKIEPNTQNAIRLINCIQENDDITYISNQFSTCPELIFNLLRHINSGAYHFKKHIDNIKQMVMLLGPSKLTSWLGLFLYGNPKEKPFGEELFNSAKFRAKMMEELALACGKHELANKAFLTGSLSLIDAYLGLSMENFLEEIHLDNEIKEALLTHVGPLGDFLHIAKEINHSNDILKTIASFKDHPCFTQEQLYSICCKANAFVTEHDKSQKEKEEL
ncbi:MAG: EAL domain-containing protein [Campylobacteraceae bacterium]|nr:EAL domain-containing protein [Campylobacteraceae bacterium]